MELSGLSTLAGEEGSILRAHVRKASLAKVESFAFTSHTASERASQALKTNVVLFCSLKPDLQCMCVYRHIIVYPH